MWQNSTEDGSPPCSPQIPILRFRLLERPFLRPARLAPTPSIEHGTDRSAGCSSPHRAEGTCLHHRGCIQTPSVSCHWFRRRRTRLSQLSSATRAAGTSIIVPIRYSARSHHHLAGNPAAVVLDELELLSRSYQRYHHFGHNLVPLLRQLTRSQEDRAGLHLENLGVYDPKSAPSESQHRVELVKTGYLGPNDTLFYAHVFGELLDLCRIRGQELVQRRIEEPDRNRQISVARRSTESSF